MTAHIIASSGGEARIVLVPNEIADGQNPLFAIGYWSSPLCPAF
jgi:hypothetical protein